MKDDYDGAEAAFRTAVELDSSDGLVAGRFGEFLTAKGKQLKNSGQVDDKTLSAIYAEAAAQLEKRDGPDNTIVQTLKLQAEELSM